MDKEHLRELYTNMSRVSSSSNEAILQEQMRRQKNVTDTILSRLSDLCPHAFVAGGAPRDWFFGEPGKDIDVFLTLDDNMSSKAHRSLLQRAVNPPTVGNIHRVGENMGEHYRDVGDISGVYEAYFLDQCVQFIVKRSIEDLAHTIDNFDLNVNMITYKDGVTTPSKAFMDGFNDKVMIQHRDVSSPSRITKLVKKFTERGYDCKGVAANPVVGHTEDFFEAIGRPYEPVNENHWKGVFEEALNPTFTPLHRL